MVSEKENIFLDTFIGSFEVCITAGNGSLGKRGKQLINNARAQLKKNYSLVNRLQQASGYFIGGTLGSPIYLTLVPAYFSMLEDRLRNGKTH